MSALRAAAVRPGWAAAIASLLLSACALSGPRAPQPVDEVDPFIGTRGTGHVFPGAVVPFGMVQPGPDNADRGWSFSSGYQYDAARILGFSNTHISGAGIPELGDFLLMPSAGRRWSATTADFSSAYAKADEHAAPGRYEVALADHGVRVELTASERVAFHRYTFDAPGPAQVLVDLQHGLNFTDAPRVQHADWTLREDGLTATVHARNWVERQASVAIRFDRRVASVQRLPPRAGERAPRLLLDFDLGRGRVLEARVAVSTVDEVGALRNLASGDALGFDAARTAASAQWNALLSRLWIDGDARQRRIVRSALYRAMIHPSQLADVDGRVRGPRGTVIQAPGGAYYSTLSLWDTFRAAHPLYTLLVPERVPGFVATLLAHEAQMGYLPLWTAWGRETHTMVGNPALPVIADAIAKDVPGIDRAAALAAMLRTSTAPRPAAPPWAQRDWDLLDRFGYLPFDHVALESVSRTAEYGYGDAALAVVARRAGDEGLARRFEARAAGWKRLFDPSTRTLRGRDSLGAWREPFDPAAATSPLKNPGDYTEANAWQYTPTPALHDPEGFRAVLGGPRGLADWLDAFFALPLPDPDKHLGQEALIGQYAHGNEPSHHVAWLYAYSDRPSEGHRRVAEIARRFYGDDPGGIVGNDDAGQMSAWLVLATLGIYPSTPGHGAWTLGAPLVRRAQLRLGPDGPLLRIEAADVDGPRLDGAPVPCTGLPHARIARGARLELPDDNLPR